MSSSSLGQRSSAQSNRGQSMQRPSMLMRLSSETKHAFKTTEFWAMCAIVAGILVASYVIGQGEGNGNADVDAFPASRAWLLVRDRGVGYMVSRGLAKAGSRDPYWAQRERPSWTHR